MRNKSPVQRLPDFFAQRIHDKGPDNRPELITPQLDQTEVDLKNILRWEDDGGQMILRPFGNTMKGQLLKVIITNNSD